MAEISRVNQAGIDFTVTQPANTSAATQTIICLHGIGGDDQSFLPQSETLSDHYRVIAWNMPGYRNSLKLESVSFQTLADALKRLMDFLGIGKIKCVRRVVRGLSSGWYAPNLACRDTESLPDLCLQAA